MGAWSRTFVFLLLGGWPFGAACILVAMLLPRDTTGGSPWLLLPGIVISAATMVLTAICFLAAYWRIHNEPPRWWLAATIYVLGCTAIVLPAYALLSR